MEQILTIYFVNLSNLKSTLLYLSPRNLFLLIVYFCLSQVKKLFMGNLFQKLGDDFVSLMDGDSEGLIFV